MRTPEVCHSLPAIRKSKMRQSDPSDSDPIYTCIIVSRRTVTILMVKRVVGRREIVGTPQQRGFHPQLAQSLESMNSPTEVSA
jgi:hypothetical protein